MAAVRAATESMRIRKGGWSWRRVVGGNVGRCVVLGVIHGMGVWSFGLGELGVGFEVGWVGGALVAIWAGSREWER
jgi:hypothetical protein